MSERQESRRERIIRKFKPKTTLALLAALSIISLTTLVFALNEGGFLVTQTATPKQTPISLSVYIDGTQWTNGTNYDWGEVEAATTYSVPMTVQNTDTRDAKIYITVAGLPLGWSLTWSQNNTIVTAGLQTAGTLQLTTPASFNDTAPQSWDMWIKADPV